jgi:hypothetical protein
VDNVVFMAVVNARKHLLHQHRSIFLAEFSALEDLIEKLTSLAESKSSF